MARQNAHSPHEQQIVPEIFPHTVLADEKFLNEHGLEKPSGVTDKIAERILDTSYWLPSYDNVDLETQLRLGVL